MREFVTTLFPINPESGVPLVPHWGWFVVLYFFMGGLTAGLYAIASALDALGDPRDRAAVRLGYTLALPGVAVCALLLVLDLGRPLRFWHMLIRADAVPLPMLKPESPISPGSWILTAFGGFALVSFMGVMAETGRLRWPLLFAAHQRWTRLPLLLRLAWLGTGAFLGFCLAGYTGVVLIGTTRPVWHNAYFLGGLFLASAASTSYALLVLLLLRRGRGAEDVTVRKLHAADRWALGIEIALLAALLLSLGRLARPLVTGGYGVVFWLGVLGGGLLFPLLLDVVSIGRGRREKRLRLGAYGALAGGLVLRFVWVMAPQWPRVPPWRL
jgi:formate-dependent nitrite reductase membrane component NrfD